MAAKKFTYSRLEDGVSYSFSDKNGKSLGIFHLIDVVPPKPKYCKHMELIIFQEVAENIVNNGDMKLLLDIYRFVFDSVLEITHELKGANLCKLYARNDLLSMVYHRFADELIKKNDYEVKTYGNWIEIKKLEKTSAKRQESYKNKKK